MTTDERDSRLDRLYREAERDVPPTHLDAAILAAARREVGARPRPVTSALRRWHVPVSIVALVVLSVSLITLIGREGGDEHTRIEPSRPAAPAASQVLERAAPSAAPPAPRDDERAGAHDRLGAIPDSARRDASRAPAAGAGTATEPGPLAKPAPEPFMAPHRVEAPETAARQAAPSGEDKPVQPPAALAERRARAAVAGAPAAEESSPKAQAGATAFKGAGREAAPAWLGYEKQPPQKWLERIAELKRRGETTAAEEMLAEFKRRFPEHPVPADLDRR